MADAEETVLGIAEGRRPVVDAVLRFVVVAGAQAPRLGVLFFAPGFTAHAADPARHCAGGRDCLGYGGTRRAGGGIGRGIGGEGIVGLGFAGRAFGCDQGDRLGNRGPHSGSAALQRRAQGQSLDRVRDEFQARGRRAEDIDCRVEQFAPRGIDRVGGVRGQDPARDVAIATQAVNPADALLDRGQRPRQVVMHHDRDELEVSAFAAERIANKDRAAVIDLEAPGGFFAFGRILVRAEGLDAAIAEGLAQGLGQRFDREVVGGEDQHLLLRRFGPERFQPGLKSPQAGRRLLGACGMPGGGCAAQSCQHRAFTFGHAMAGGADRDVAVDLVLGQI